MLDTNSGGFLCPNTIENLNWRLPGNAFLMNLVVRFQNGSVFQIVISVTGLKSIVSMVTIRLSNVKPPALLKTNIV
jgi:hypothetical protein